MSNIPEGVCKHCDQPIIAFEMLSTGKPGLWYLNTKPRPRRATFNRPAETEEDLASYKPWNDQIRTVPCRQSPVGRHAPKGDDE